MKRLVMTVVVMLALLPTTALADGQYVKTFSATGTDSGINLSSSGVSFNKLTWTVTGAPAACSVQLDSSVDGVAWSAGNAIGAQTCTSNGSSVVTAGTFNYIRINITALSAAATVTVVWTGYVNAPISTNVTNNSTTFGLTELFSQTVTGGSKTLDSRTINLTSGDTFAAWTAAGMGSGGTFLKFNNNADVFHVRGDGHVGIGQAAGNDMLDVTGAIAATTSVSAGAGKFVVDSTGTPTAVAGLTTAGSGVPIIVAKYDATLNAANITATTVYTTPATGAGLYVASCYLVVTQAATTSSTLPQCLINWTDADSNIATGAFTTVTTTGNTVGGTNSTATASGVSNAGVAALYAKASTVIQVGTAGYASSGATPMQYAIHVKLEYLGN